MCAPESILIIVLCLYPYKDLVYCALHELCCVYTHAVFLPLVPTTCFSNQSSKSFTKSKGMWEIQSSTVNWHLEQMVRSDELWVVNSSRKLWQFGSKHGWRTWEGEFPRLKAKTFRKIVKKTTMHIDTLRKYN